MIRHTVLYVSPAISIIITGVVFIIAVVVVQYVLYELHTSQCAYNIYDEVVLQYFICKMRHILEKASCVIKSLLLTTKTVTRIYTTGIINSCEGTHFYNRLLHYISTSLSLGLQDGDHVSQSSLRSDDALGVLGKHEGDSDTNDALSQHDVTHSGVNILGGSEARLNHISISIFLRLSSLPPELTGHNNLSTLGARLHDEAEDTIARLSDGKASEKLVFERLGLGLSAKTAVGNALGEQVDGSLREVESLLDDGGQLADALALLSEDVLGAGGLDDDLGLEGSHADLHTGIAILAQLTSKQLAQNE